MSCLNKSNVKMLNTAKNHYMPRHKQYGNVVVGEIKEHQEPYQQRRVEIDELDKAIGTLNRSLNASSYQLLLLIREFDERAGWLRWSFEDGVSWLKWRCDLGTGTAREKLRIAHAIKELPLISQAFSEGRLSYSKVRVMTRVATPENEAELIELAKRMTVLHLTEHCKQRANAKKESIASAKAAHDAREFRVWRDQARGVMNFSIELPIEQGELLEKAIEKAAVKLTAETGALHSPHGDEPSWSSRQADAVLYMAREYLNPSENDHKTKRSSTADNYQVVVHVDESALVATADSDLPVTSQYPIETVRRLCCDGSIIPIVENAKGEPLNVGRKVRTVPTAIRRGLWSRDRGCAFPGCHHTRFVDAHHIEHWADGGETSLDNLVLLCSNHHALLHEGGYSVKRDQSGNLFFRRPDGKAVPDCGFYCEDWTDSDVEVVESNDADGPSSVKDSDAREFSVGRNPGTPTDNSISDDPGEWVVGRATIH